jgi:opacity protein-like surface antigen
MKKITLSFVSAVALSGFAVAGGDIAPVEPMVETPTPVITESGFYGGLGYGYFKQSTDSPLNVDVESDSIVLQAGYQYNDYLAFEGRYWIGMGGVDQTPMNASGDFDAWGLYIKPMYPVNESFDIYALLGYADSTIDYDSSWDWETDGFSWGIGVQYEVMSNIVLFADYVCMASDDSVDINSNSVSADIDLYTVNFGVTYKF